MQVIGQGKYGVIYFSVHKRTKLEVAIKVVKKKDLSLTDMELLRREIEILMICSHQSIC